MRGRLLAVGTREDSIVFTAPDTTPSAASGIRTVLLYDRPNLPDYTPGGTLTFSDGSPVRAIAGS